MKTWGWPLPCGAIGCFCPPGLAGSTGLGACVLAGTRDGPVEVLQADPVIAVIGYLLRDWHATTLGCVSLECRRQPDCIGDVIRVSGTRHVVYVVTRVADRVNGVWEARWPD